MKNQSDCISKTISNKKADSETQNDTEKNMSFAADLKHLMFAFGDVENPDPDSLQLLEDYVIEYIQNISINAFRRSKNRGANEIKLRDLVAVVKNDRKKYYRIPPLITTYENFRKITPKGPKN